MKKSDARRQFEILAYPFDFLDAPLEPGLRKLPWKINVAKRTLTPLI